MTEAVRPRAGVRVLEMGTLIAGPSGGRILTAFGAAIDDLVARANVACADRSVVTA